MSEDERGDSPDPPPSVTPGLEPGGGVRPGDTPPASDSMSETSGEVRRDTPNMGPVSGNRTPMIITLVILGIIVLAAAGFTVASLLAS